MNHAIVVRAIGGPEALEWTEIPTPQPNADEVVVEIEAAGVNFIDVYQRNGLYPMDVPFGLGLEGAGTVTAVGNDASNTTIGDRVAWTSSIGSYSEHKAVREEALVRIPSGIDTRIAAAAMLQGLTAHYLAMDTHRLEPGHKALIHAGAGGVGLLLTQVAKLLGAEVFTTVGSEEKAELSRNAGADHAILYNEVDFAKKVEAIAGPRPLHVVYDGVGKSVFDQSLGLLRKRGSMITYGNASGPVDPVSPLKLSSNGSLFLTRPTLFDYIATPEEFQMRASDLFGWISSGEVNVRIGAEFPMAEAGEAHQALEGRRTTGKVLLIP